MKLETPMIALIASSLVFAGLFSVFITDLGPAYGADMNLTLFTTDNREVSLENTFDRLNKTKSDMDEVSASFTEQTVTDSGSLFGFLKLTWVIGKQMLSNVTILKDLLYGASALIGVPPIFITAAVTITIMLIIISIVMILAGRTY